MKAFTVFLVVSVGFCCAQIRITGSIGGSINSENGVDISNFTGISGLYNAAGSETAKDSVLEATAAAFLTKFRNGAFLQGKSASDIKTAFKENARKLLSGPIPDWEITLDSELLGLTEAEFKRLFGTRSVNRTDEENSNNIGSSRSKREESEERPPKKNKI